MAARARGPWDLYWLLHAQLLHQRAEYWARLRGLRAACRAAEGTPQAPEALALGGPLLLAAEGQGLHVQFWRTGR